MVAADCALLSFAVLLSTIGFGAARGEGRYARHRQRIADRDESDVSHTFLQVATDSVTSTPVLTSTPAPPPRGPAKPTSEAGSAPVYSSVTLDFGHSAAGQEGEGAPNTDSSSSSIGPAPSASEDVSSLAYNTLQQLTDSVTSTPTVAPTVRPPVVPGKKTTALTSALPSTTLDFGHGGDSSDVASSETISYNTLQTLTDIVTSTPTVAPTVRPPVVPGKKSTTLTSALPSTTLDFGHGGDSSDPISSDLSTSTIGVKATYLNSDVSSSSSSVEYIDPGLYGAGGTLTTDSNGLTRTVYPSRSSVIPNPTSRLGPPPADTYSPTTTSSKTPALPTTSRSVNLPGLNQDASSTAGDNLSYLPGQVLTPGSPPPSPTTTSVIRPTVPSIKGGTYQTTLTLPTIDLGHSAPPDDAATPTSSTDSPAVTTWWPTANSTGPWGNSTYGNSSITTISIPLSQWSYTASESLTTDDRGSTGTVCMPADGTKASTTYSVIYTSTITWYGNPEDYTPPYAPISTPKPCIPPKDPLRFTASWCIPTIGTERSISQSCITQTLSLVYSTAAPGFIPAPTITFVTTDKNPTVVYSTIQTPDYGVNPGTKDQVDHTSASPTTDPPEYQSQVAGNSGLGGGNAGSSGNNGGGGGPAPTGNSGGGSGSGGSGSGSGNGSGSGSGGSGNGNGSGDGGVGVGSNPGATANNPGHAPAQAPITVGVQPTAVVVNGQTISDNPAAPTQTIIVGSQAVTINPTQVIVAGQTVTRPGATGGVYIPTPTSTNIQGVPVVVSSSIAIIGGTSFTLGPTATTTIINNQPVTIGPSGVVVASTTIPVVFMPTPTQVAVEGGELITAIGPSVVVIHGTTITYGPDKPASTTVVDDDTITIGPSGVVVHGTTIGGPTARSSDSQYEIVGGATITQIGPSVVVINNATYTVGPGAGTTTTVVGGETITIGPSGVAVGTHTIAYPFGPTTTITPKATGTAPTASPTASKDAGLALRPDAWRAFVCIAIGVVGFAV